LAGEARVSKEEGGGGDGEEKKFESDEESDEDCDDLSDDQSDRKSHDRSHDTYLNPQGNGGGRERERGQEGHARRSEGLGKTEGNVTIDFVRICEEVGVQIVEKGGEEYNRNRELWRAVKRGNATGCEQLFALGAQVFLLCVCW